MLRPQRGEVPHRLRSFLIRGYTFSGHKSTEQGALINHNLGLLLSKADAGLDDYVEEGFQAQKMVQNMPGHPRVPFAHIHPEDFIVSLRRQLHFGHPLTTSWLFDDVVHRTLLNVLNLLRVLRRGNMDHKGCSWQGRAPQSTTAAFFLAGARLSGRPRQLAQPA